MSEKLILPREREHENQAFWQHQSPRSISVLCEIRVQEH
jgi:hypothetical protein